MMDLSEDFKKHVSDYKIDLCEVSFLEDEIINKFQSDFRVVARYFVSKRLGNAAETMYNENKKWAHVGELMEFFRTFTNDRRFGEFKQFMLNEADKKGEVGMCELLDAFERKGLEKGLERGMARGLERGLERGEEKGRYESLQKLIEKTGMSELEAMNALDFSSKEKTGYRNWVNQ